jgi:transcriptional regulator with XRE-family HTH domain
MDIKQLPFHEKIKELRDTHGWTQNELADKLGTDGRMISHYEKGKNIPSADILIKIAELFNVSIDYLLIDRIPKRPLNQNGDVELLEKISEISNLPEKDKEMIKHMINSIITKNKLKELATTAS